MTREEHLEWCKVRARAYLDQGQAAAAITSLMSDLTKHPETVKLVSDSNFCASATEAGIESLELARNFVERLK